MLSMVNNSEHAHAAPSAAYPSHFVVPRRHDEPDAEMEPRYMHHYVTSSSTSYHQDVPASDTSSNATTTSKPRKSRSTKSKCPPGLRAGKWTLEEEAYTTMLIHYFKRGLLQVEDGTSLRWFLAKRLNCEAMRVTKKLKGNSSVGKQVFRARESTPENRRAIAMAAAELEFMEKAFLDSIVATSGHFAAASPASAVSVLASAAASSGSTNETSTRPGLAAISTVMASRARSQSEDARLLLHFFTEASDGATDGSNSNEDLNANADTSSSPSAQSSPSVEKKRFFSDLDDASTHENDEDIEDSAMISVDSPCKRRPMGSSSPMPVDVSDRG